MLSVSLVESALKGANHPISLSLTVKDNGSMLANCDEVVL